MTEATGPYVVGGGGVRTGCWTRVSWMLSVMPALTARYGLVAMDDMQSLGGPSGHLAVAGRSSGERRE